jgi:hypothetical protein
VRFNNVRNLEPVMIRISHKRQALFLSAGLALSGLILGGCQMSSMVLSGTMSPDSPSSPSAVTLGGSVHGGQQPVVGSAIQLYAAGTAGYGTGATALIPALPSGSQYFAGGQPGCVASGSQTCYANVVTDSTGSFNLTGDYACPSGASQIYIVSKGGNPGAGTNAELALMAALGSCSSLSSSTSININEVTTVAAVTALQQFMSVTNGTPGAFSIGAPSTTYGGVASAILGMSNAFATANVLAPYSTGLSAKTTSTTAGVPSVTPDFGRVYLEANILASCVNSVDSGGPSAACTSLFADVKPQGVTQPSDTVQAMYAIATNPTYSFGTICGLATANNPYASALACNAASLSDFSIAVAYFPTYNSGTVSSPVIANAVCSAYGIAVDAYGNVWTTSATGTTVPFFYGATEIGPTGSLLTGPITGFSVGGTAHSMTKPHYVAIDQSNNAWVPNTSDTITGGYVAVLPGSTGVNASTSTSSATAVGYATDSGSVVASPYAITVSGNNNVYITNSASTVNTVSEFANASTTSTESTALSVGATPVGIVTDTSANANGPFVYASGSTACSGIGDVAEFKNTVGGAAANAVFASSTATCTAPAATSTITATTGTPIGMAVDKNGNLWLANGVTAAGSVTYLVTDGAGGIGTTSTSSVSFAQTSVLVPYNIAVDGNNNAWVINASGSAFNELSVSTSSGSPVITPLTGTTGLIHADVSASKLNTPRQGAIDSSGNLWITSSQSGDLAYVSAIVGIAAPVVTPLSVALKNNHIGQKP